MKSSYSYISKLEIGGKELKYYSPIKKVLVTRGRVLVLLERVGIEIDETKEHKFQNLYAYNMQGKKLWVNEKLKPFQKNLPVITGIYSKENEEYAIIHIGVEYKINMLNGSLTPVSDQRPW